MQKLDDAEQYIKAVPFLETPDFAEMVETLSAAKKPCEIEEFGVGEELFFDGYQVSGWELCCTVSIKFIGDSSKKTWFVPVLGKTKKGWARYTKIGFDFEKFVIARYAEARKLNTLEAIEISLKH